MSTIAYPLVPRCKIVSSPFRSSEFSMPTLAKNENIRHCRNSMHEWGEWGCSLQEIIQEQYNYKVESFFYKINPRSKFDLITGDIS